MTHGLTAHSTLLSHWLYLGFNKPRLITSNHSLTNPHYLWTLSHFIGVRMLSYCRKMRIVNCWDLNQLGPVYRGLFTRQLLLPAAKVIDEPLCGQTACIYWVNQPYHLEKWVESKVQILLFSPVLLTKGFVGSSSIFACYAD